jgi:hypothetical protein
LWEWLASGSFTIEFDDEWRSRSGAESVDRDQFETALPQYLPVVSPTQNGIYRG